MGTTLTKYDEAKLQAIEDAVAEGQLAVAGEEGKRFGQALTIAAAIRRIGDLITEDMMGDLMMLQGKSLGFRTDKDSSGGYPVGVVKECFIEATLFGARPGGNEFNIISERPYFTKEYFERRVREHPNIVGLMYRPGAFELKAGNAHVEFVAQWQTDGRECSIQKTVKKLQDGQPFDDRVVVRVNAGMGYDAIIGKAKRKLFREILMEVDVVESVPMDGEISDTIDVDSRPTTRESSLFSDEPAAEQEATAESSQDEQPSLLNEYFDQLAAVEDKREITPIARAAGQDARLTAETRKAVMDRCAERRKEL